MRSFTALYVALDASTRTTAKVAALCAYFRTVPALDAAWATYFLTGRKLKRLVRTADLRRAAITASGIPDWLFEASHEAVGDFAETVALLLPPPTHQDDQTLAEWMDQRVAPLAGLPPGEVELRLHDAWARLDRDARLVFGKLLSGAFRVGAGPQLVIRALGEAAGIPSGDVAQRLTGDWLPRTDFWEWLRGTQSPSGPAPHRPYPFLLAHALDVPIETLGPREAWQAEWKWDGVRAQLIVDAAGASLWSRGGDLVSEQFPEAMDAARTLPPGTIVDGELLAWSRDIDVPAPFATLQRRLGRKAPGRRVLQEAPVVLLAYDLLQSDGVDMRAEPLHVRRAALERLLADVGPVVRLAPVLAGGSWEQLRDLRAAARARHAEGLMLKRLDSAYEAGRVRGSWWKWKIDPHTIDAVLVYAQAGSGRRASLYTDYTFAVWHEGALVPFAKAYSGLDDAEIRRLDAWIRSHTLEKFGPVRSVEPAQVFELAFEGVQVSKRHKSGVAVRFPRIVRWRQDKLAADADTLKALAELARPANVAPDVPA